MTRIHACLAALLAALVLAGCTAKEIIVATPVDLGVEIRSVTGTKVNFQVTAGNQDACYIYFTLSKQHLDFDIPEKEAARNYLDYLEEVYNEQEEHIGSFADWACYRGSREVRLMHLSSGVRYKLLLFQVHPGTREIIGDVRSVIFQTPEVPMTPMDISFALKGTTLIITPSDPGCGYIWSVDRLSRINDDFGSPYFYLYSVIDMFERYGFIEALICKGPDSYEIPVESLWQRETYCVCAVAYDQGEITSYDYSFYFTLRGDTVVEVDYRQPVWGNDPVPPRF